MTWPIAVLPGSTGWCRTGARRCPCWMSAAAAATCCGDRGLGARRGVAVTLAGLDRSPWAARYAEAAGVPARFITADLFDARPGGRFDVVLCSLFTHHLRDPELVRFLRWLEDRARLGWLISDLHRHWLPWGVIWAGGSGHAVRTRW